MYSQQYNGGQQNMQEFHNDVRDSTQVRSSDMQKHGFNSKQYPQSNMEVGDQTPQNNGGLMMDAKFINKFNKNVTNRPSGFNQQSSTYTNGQPQSQFNKHPESFKKKGQVKTQRLEGAVKNKFQSNQHNFMGGQGRANASNLQKAFSPQPQQKVKFHKPLINPHVRSGDLSEFMNSTPRTSNFDSSNNFNSIHSSRFNLKGMDEGQALYSPVTANRQKLGSKPQTHRGQMKTNNNSNMNQVKPSGESPSKMNRMMSPVSQNPSQMNQKNFQYESAKNTSVRQNIQNEQDQEQYYQEVEMKSLPPGQQKTRQVLAQYLNNKGQNIGSVLSPSKFTSMPIDNEDHLDMNVDDHVAPHHLYSQQEESPIETKKQHAFGSTYIQKKNMGINKRGFEDKNWQMTPAPLGSYNSNIDKNKQKQMRSNNISNIKFQQMGQTISISPLKQNKQSIANEGFDGSKLSQKQDTRVQRGHQTQVPAIRIMSQDKTPNDHARILSQDQRKSGNTESQPQLRQGSQMHLNKRDNVNSKGDLINSGVNRRIEGIFSTYGSGQNANTRSQQQWRINQSTMQLNTVKGQPVQKHYFQNNGQAAEITHVITTPGSGLANKHAKLVQQQMQTNSNSKFGNQQQINQTTIYRQQNQQVQRHISAYDNEPQIVSHDDEKDNSMTMSDNPHAKAIDIAEMNDIMSSQQIDVRSIGQLQNNNQDQSMLSYQNMDRHRLYSENQKLNPNAFNSQAQNIGQILMSVNSKISSPSKQQSKFVPPINRNKVPITFYPSGITKNQSQQSLGRVFSACNEGVPQAIEEQRPDTQSTNNGMQGRLHHHINQVQSEYQRKILYASVTSVQSFNQNFPCNNVNHRGPHSQDEDFLQTARSKIQTPRVNNELKRVGGMTNAQIQKEFTGNIFKPTVSSTNKSKNFIQQNIKKAGQLKDKLLAPQGGRQNLKHMLSPREREGPRGDFNKSLGGVNSIASFRSYKSPLSQSNYATNTSQAQSRAANNRRKPKTLREQQIGISMQEGASTTQLPFNSSNLYGQTGTTGGGVDRATPGGSTSHGRYPVNTQQKSRTKLDYANDEVAPKMFSAGPAETRRLDPPNNRKGFKSPAQTSNKSSTSLQNYSKLKSQNQQRPNQFGESIQQQFLAEPDTARGVLAMNDLRNYQSSVNSQGGINGVQMPTKNQSHNNVDIVQRVSYISNTVGSQGGVKYSKMSTPLSGQRIKPQAQIVQQPINTLGSPRILISDRELDDVSEDQQEGEIMMINEQGTNSRLSIRQESVKQKIGNHEQTDNSFLNQSRYSKNSKVTNISKERFKSLERHNERIRQLDELEQQKKKKESGLGLNNIQSLVPKSVMVSQNTNERSISGVQSNYYGVLRAGPLPIKKNTLDFQQNAMDALNKSLEMKNHLRQELDKKGYQVELASQKSSDDIDNSDGQIDLPQYNKFSRMSQHRDNNSGMQIAHGPHQELSSKPQDLQIKLQLKSATFEQKNKTLENSLYNDKNNHQMLQPIANSNRVNHEGQTPKRQVLNESAGLIKNKDLMLGGLSHRLNQSKVIDLQQLQQESSRSKMNQQDENYHNENSFHKRSQHNGGEMAESQSYVMIDSDMNRRQRNIDANAKHSKSIHSDQHMDITQSEHMSETSQRNQSSVTPSQTYLKSKDVNDSQVTTQTELNRYEAFCQNMTKSGMIRSTIYHIRKEGQNIYNPQECEMYYSDDFLNNQRHINEKVEQELQEFKVEITEKVSQNETRKFTFPRPGGEKIHLNTSTNVINVSHNQGQFQDKRNPSKHDLKNKIKANGPISQQQQLQMQATVKTPVNTKKKLEGSVLASAAQPKNHNSSKSQTKYAYNSQNRTSQNVSKTTNQRGPQQSSSSYNTNPINALNKSPLKKQNLHQNQDQNRLQQQQQRLINDEYR